MSSPEDFSVRERGAVDAAAGATFASAIRRARPTSAIKMSANTRAKCLLMLMVGAVDVIWMQLGGFQYGDGYVQYLAVTIILGVIAFFYSYSGRDARIAAFAQMGAQVTAAYVVLIPLGYLAASTNAPLVDPAFDAIDKAIGLNWLAWNHWVSEHPWLNAVLLLAYASVTIQAIPLFIYNAHRGASDRNSEFWWIATLGALITIAIGAVVPATSAWVYYGLRSMNDIAFMRDFAAMRDGAMHVISLFGAQGMVQLPSYHTVIAIMFIYNLRGRRVLFPAALVLNGLMILACPTDGGHYFIDIPAGAVVAALSIWGARTIERRLGSPLPRPAFWPRQEPELVR